MSEQRRFPRKAIKVQFTCRDEAAAGTLSFDSGDVSAGGAFLVSDILYEVGEPLALEFDVPGSGLSLRAHARVAWVRRFPTEGQAAGVGVEFMELSAAARGALEAWIRSA